MAAKTPIFLGSAGSGKLTPLPGASMQKNAYGIDVLSRPYSCPRSKVSSSIPSKGSADIFYKNLRFTGNYSVTEDEGLMCMITLEYKGLLGNFLPDPIVSYGMGTGAASGSYSETDTDPRLWRTVDILFTAPSKTVKYISAAPVLTPASSYDGASPFIIQRRIVDGNGRGCSDMGLLVIRRMTFVEDMQSTQVPGTPFYENQEVWKTHIELKTP